MNDDETRQELREAGVPDDLHDDALSVKPAFDRHGVWPILLALFRRVPSSEAWRVVELAKALAGAAGGPAGILTFYQGEPMSEQKHDSARDLDAAGVPPERHDEARTLQPLALAKGVDWLALLAVLKRHGPDALGVIRDVLAVIRAKPTPPAGQDQV